MCISDMFDHEVIIIRVRSALAFSFFADRCRGVPILQVLFDITLCEKSLHLIKIQNNKPISKTNIIKSWKKQQDKIARSPVMRECPR